MQQAARPVARTAAITSSGVEAGYVKLSTLNLWDKNPRKNDIAAEPLAKLLALNTLRSPIVAWNRNRVIYKGNTTFKAMTMLHKNGLDKYLTAQDRQKIQKALDTITDPKEKASAIAHRVRFEQAVTAGEVWCVLQPFPSESAAVAYAISDNKASEFSDWDDSVLAGLQQAYHFSAPVIGFSAKELETLEANVGSFAAQTYEQVAEAFEKQKVGKKDVLWFWFEVDSKESLEYVKARYSRTNEKGKRLHRELDWELLAPIMGYDIPVKKLAPRKVLRMKEAGRG